MCPLCANFQRCPASGIAKQAVATVELAFERRKGAIKSGVSILRPSRSSDLRDKGRSTLTVPRVKLIFSPRDYLWHVQHCIAQATAKGQWNIHTHTHTHTQGCQLIRFAYKFMLPSKRCYAHANWATITKKKKKKKNFKSIFISFLAIRWYMVLIEQQGFVAQSESLTMSWTKTTRRKLDSDTSAYFMRSQFRIV